MIVADMAYGRVTVCPSQEWGHSPLLTIKKGTSLKQEVKKEDIVTTVLSKSLLHCFFKINW
jgi:hypothetical protein